MHIPLPYKAYTKASFKKTLDIIYNEKLNKFKKIRIHKRPIVLRQKYSPQKVFSFEDALKIYYMRNVSSNIHSIWNEDYI